MSTHGSSSLLSPLILLWGSMNLNKSQSFKKHSSKKNTKKIISITSLDCALKSAELINNTTINHITLYISLRLNQLMWNYFNLMKLTVYHTRSNNYVFFIKKNYTFFYLFHSFYFLLAYLYLTKFMK